jgi:apolipoprotein N-acyltransferase
LIVIPAVLALLSSGLLVLSLPRYDAGYLAWVGLVPLLWMLRTRKGGVFFSFFVSSLFGFAFIFWNFKWLLEVRAVRILDYSMPVVYFALYHGSFGALYHLATRRTGFPPVLSAPLLWVALEYIRSNAGFLSLPWALLGHSQYRTLPAIQIADISGVYGVSFVIVLVNAAIVEAAFCWFRSASSASPRKWPVAQLVFSGVILALTFGYGIFCLSRGQETPLSRVTVIQGNIPQSIRWERALEMQHLEKHMRLTEAAVASDRPALVIWPESTVPGSLRMNAELGMVIGKFARKTGIPFFIGSSENPKFGTFSFRTGHWLNSAFLVAPDGSLKGQYDKIQLLPFAEYIPLQDMIPWPKRILSKSSPYLRGKNFTVFRWGDLEFAGLICWESIFPDLTRRFVKNGARFLVNIGNEAWFGETSAPYQFLSMNVFRAVENRVALVRSTNTGVSCFIDPAGRIIGRVARGGKDIFVDGYLTMGVPAPGARSFFTMFGDVFACANVVAALGLVFYMVVFRKRVASQGS